jgi:chromosomal replication initiation ATPase DnaA
MPWKERSITGIPSALNKTLADLLDGLLPWPLTLYGDVGTGKTCAALVLCDYTDGDYYTAEQFSQRYELSRKGALCYYVDGHTATIWPSDFWKQVRACPLFALDELGTRERVNETLYYTLLTLLDTRTLRATVLVSNLDLQELEKVYDYRIVSRLLEGTVVNLQGEDRRRKVVR